MFAGRILAGALLLVLGRKLFWLYVAVLGFATGLSVASRLFNVQPEWLQLLVGIAFGILGALLAYFFQEVAVAVAGFMGGSYVATSLLASFGYNPGQAGDLLVWGLFIAGGIVGAVLVVILFDWALILLTSLTGALLVVEGLSLALPGNWLVVLVLFIIGVIIQAGIEGLNPREDRTRTTSGTI